MGLIRRMLDNGYVKVFGVIFLFLLFGFCAVLFVLVAVDCNPCLEFRKSVTDGSGYAEKL